MACDPTQHADLGAVLLHEGMESKIFFDTCVPQITGRCCYSTYITVKRRTLYVYGCLG